MRSERKNFPQKPLTFDRPRFIRGLVLGFVLALHIAGAALLSTPSQVISERQRASALQVRFIEMIHVSTTVPLGDPLSTVPPDLYADKGQRVVRPSEPSRASSKKSASPEARNPIDLTLPSLPQGGSYAPGGRRLSDASEMRRSRVRIPGAKTIHGAPSFQMIDPKMQGVAVGLVRAIGGITGAEDPRCVDLDVWQGMTPEERIKNHISEEDMENIQANHNCGTPGSRRRLAR